ncbi:MAG TPA: hypothetical protein VK171_05645 [Fimbriimonas sp.]|nr:hypothetical protein [Fimbriimonas sp.]
MDNVLFHAEQQVHSFTLSNAEMDIIASELQISEPILMPMQTVAQFAANNGVKPLLVARTLSQLRPADEQLPQLINSTEFIIKNFGKKRLTREIGEADVLSIKGFWRNNDPLGVYQPGDMFYIDPNHPWRPYFPILILVPLGLALLPLAFSYLVMILRAFGR